MGILFFAMQENTYFNRMLRDFKKKKIVAECGNFSFVFLY